MRRTRSPCAAARSRCDRESSRRPGSRPARSTNASIAASGLPDLVRDARREPAHGGQPLRALEAGAGDAQIRVRVAQLGHRLLERSGAARQRLAHRRSMPRRPPRSRAGRSERARAAKPPAASSRVAIASCSSGATTRRRSSVTPNAGEERHVDREQQRDQRERRSAHRQRRRRARDEDRAVGSGRREAERLPGRARLEQRGTALERSGRECGARRVDLAGTAARRTRRPVGPDTPPDGAGQHLRSGRTRATRLGEQRASEQIALARLAGVEEQQHDDQRRRAHHQREARHHLGEQPAARRAGAHRTALLVSARVVVQAELLEPVAERAERDAEQVRGALLHAARRAAARRGAGRARSRPPGCRDRRRHRTRARRSRRAVSDAVACPSAGGSASASIHSPRESATARSMLFSSSRTLPGQAWARSSRIASSLRPRTGLPSSRAYFSRKWWTSSGTSSTRSRSGGSWSWMTFSR